MTKAEALDFFGGPTKLGALLGLTRQAIWSWPDEVPDLYQYKLHHMSAEKLPLTVAPPSNDSSQHLAAP